MFVYNPLLVKMECLAPKGAGHYSSEWCFIRQLIPSGKRQSVAPAEDTFILELKTFNSCFSKLPLIQSEMPGSKKKKKLIRKIKPADLHISLFP